MSRILVAEDNLPNRELVREILKAWGHEVIEAEDSQQALDKIEAMKPELVLLDIQMPILDGYAVVPASAAGIFVKSKSSRAYPHSHCRETGRKFCNEDSKLSD